MATKTFKIGLSNTDKANMSQDIYERVEELLFNEYDPTSTYNTNDYVIYDDDLYRAIADNITGAWDSTKWQSATLNDLVDLVNGAAASVNGKANTEDLIDGSLVPNQSVFAKELIPVSEESGETQEEPFILQGTGTDNNTNSVDTGSTAKQLEKQGNTIVYNQLLTGNGTTETINGITFTHNNDGSITVSGTATADTNHYFTGPANGILANHTYLLKGCPTGGSSTSFTLFCTGSLLDRGSGGVFTFTNSSSQVSCRIEVKNGYSFETPVIFIPKLIDLTQWFNGDIPQDLINNPSHFSNYYNGELEYNLGELRNCNGRYLETTGRNLFDGVLEGNGLNNAGEPATSNHAFRTKNFINVIGGTPFIISYNQTDLGGFMYYCIYDSNEEIIGVRNQVVGATSTINLPSQAKFIKLQFYKEGSNWASNVPSVDDAKIVVSLYYTTQQGGEGYDQYYPYEQPKIYDTGTEELLSTGVKWNDAHTARIDAHDIKRPDGTIIRNVGVVDLGTLNWVYVSSSTRFYSAGLTGLIKGLPYSTTIKPNILCSKYVASTNAVIYDQTGDKVISLDQDGNILIRDTNYTDGATLKTSLSGVMLYYEIATPTPKVGTPFAENIEINDYGMMSWKDTNNNYVEVPQGCKIFYPAWYVGFIDSLGARANWKASNIPLNSELNNKFLSFLTSITGYDDTKTQTLKNVTGTLTWVDD